MAFRRCGETGFWLGKRVNETSQTGWTNYTPCFPPEVQTLFVKVYENEKDAQMKFQIAQRTRYMEIVGFSISLVALILSLVIFTHYRSLRNNRTRIHKSLFSAMVVQVLIRLTVYIDQALVRSSLGDHSTYDNVTLKGIDNMPFLCETSYVLLEYAITVMFMWMFIEGLYLHNVVTANALREKISYAIYYATGWGLPLIVTAVWATVTALHYEKERVKKCWYGYNFSRLYWIVQGPRLAVIMVNLGFLLNIMRVLIVKLRQSENTEVEKVRKAARAALVLLPLLGITNALNMAEPPLDSSIWEFGLWSYSTHLLRSFQGFFIALIYCFLNGEVRQVIKKHYQNYMAMRLMNNRNNREPFFAFFSLTSSSGGNRATRNLNNKEESAPSWIPMINLRKSTDDNCDNKVADTEIGIDYEEKTADPGHGNNIESAPTFLPMNNMKRSAGDDSSDRMGDAEVGIDDEAKTYLRNDIEESEASQMAVMNLELATGEYSGACIVTDIEIRIEYEKETPEPGFKKGDEHYTETNQIKE